MGKGLNRSACPTGSMSYLERDSFCRRQIGVAEFGEGRLCEMDGKVAVVVSKVREGITKELIDVAHEVDLTEFVKLLLEQLFFFSITTSTA